MPLPVGPGLRIGARDLYRATCPGDRLLVERVIDPVGGSGGASVHGVDGVVHGTVKGRLLLRHKGLVIAPRCGHELFMLLAEHGAAGLFLTNEVIELPLVLLR